MSSLKDQLQGWKTKHEQELVEPEAKAPERPQKRGLNSPKAAARAQAEAARRAAGAAGSPDAEEAEELDDDALFLRAVDDIGDGSVAILEKYGQDDRPGRRGPRTNKERRQEAAKTAQEQERGRQLGETALFLDAVEGVRRLPTDEG